MMPASMNSTNAPATSHPRAAATAVGSHLATQPQASRQRWCADFVRGPIGIGKLPMTDTADPLTSGARCVRKEPNLVWRQRGGEADVGSQG